MLTAAILHYNKDKLTYQCLDSILKQDIPVEHEILVVDNGSDYPFTLPDSKWEKVRVVRLQENVGNIGGQNACFSEAKYLWVLFVSNDVIFLPGAIKSIWKNRDYSMQLMPVILNQDLTTQSEGGDYIWPGYGINRRKFRDKCIDYCPSITYLLHKSFWLDAGKFDESLPMTYEDVDFGRRCVCGVDTSAKAIHQANSTLQYTKRDKWRFHRGRIQVIQKRYKGWNKWIRIGAVNVIDSLNYLISLAL